MVEIASRRSLMLKGILFAAHSLRPVSHFVDESSTLSWAENPTLIWAPRTIAQDFNCRKSMQNIKEFQALYLLLLCRSAQATCNFHVTTFVETAYGRTSPNTCRIFSSLAVILGWQRNEMDPQNPSVLSSKCKLDDCKFVTLLRLVRSAVLMSPQVSLAFWSQCKLDKSPLPTYDALKIKPEELTQRT